MVQRGQWRIHNRKLLTDVWCTEADSIRYSVPRKALLSEGLLLVHGFHQVKFLPQNRHRVRHDMRFVHAISENRNGNWMRCDLRSGLRAADAAGAYRCSHSHGAERPCAIIRYPY